MAWEDLPKLRHGNFVNLMKRYIEITTMAHCRHHKPKRSGLWAKNRPEPDEGVTFSLNIDLISGPTPNVNELAIRLATDALSRGDQEYAQAIVDVLHSLPDLIRKRAKAAEHAAKMSRFQK